jgi:hypothetical protein
MLKKHLIYKVKPGNWFIGNTFAILIDDYRHRRPSIDVGIFWGIRQCDNPDSESRKYGEIYLDEEDCSFDEFDPEPIGEVELYENKL